MRSFHFPGRSVVYSRKAMCATSHPTATRIGLEIMKSGGNAVDASIAVAAALAVIEPAMTGVGGDCFAILWKPGQGLIGLDAAGRAPAAATAQWYADKGIRSIEMQSPHAVTVPGAVDGWARLLADHGTMSFERVLAPAIELAEAGFVVAPRVALDWSKAVQKLQVHAGARTHLLAKGAAPAEGEIMRFPALAGTLKAIAADGRDAFYQGEIAKDLVATLNGLGGVHTLGDFAQQRARYVNPISAHYRGIDVYELPPANQGITALMILKIVARVPGFADMPAFSTARYHVLMEAARLAYAFRDSYLADPDQADVPTDFMLSDALAEELAQRVDAKRSRPDLGPIPKPRTSDTTCFSVVDGDGFAVSFINSLFKAFGSGIVGEKSGVTLHNRGQGFRLEAGHPNAIAPRKRPLHTLVPGFALRNGAPYLSFSVMGGDYQAIGHAQLVSSLVDCGLDPQEAVDLPRMFFEGGTLAVEEAIPEAMRLELERMGHKTSQRADPWGGAQLILIDQEKGLLAGASDGRKDGIALGL
ncbi:MAG: gamma-glutamyltransferase [Hyphomicrobiaceae bacterium]|nr:MAG: gamma-glutamyltransferase [Hyphomicrobiaceae bacterium]